MMRESGQKAIDIQKIAAFSDGDKGGNPAGVLISESHPEAIEMQRIAGFFRNRICSTT